MENTTHIEYTVFYWSKKTKSFSIEGPKYLDYLEAEFYADLKEPYLGAEYKIVEIIY